MDRSTIRVEVAPGELIDKITILEIKDQRIDDAAKRVNVRHELSSLTETWDSSVVDSSSVDNARRKLKKVNETLWEIEDQIREKESRGEFDDEFIRTPMCCCPDRL